MRSVRWDNGRNTALFEYADNFVGKGLEPSPILMPGGWTSQHQMSTNGKYVDITRQYLLEFTWRRNIKDAAEITEGII